MKTVWIITEYVSEKYVNVFSDFENCLNYIKQNYTFLRYWGDDVDGFIIETKEKGMFFCEEQGVE